MTRNIKLTLVCILSLCLKGLYAQQAITTSGGNASASSGSVSYSVGQIVYKTNSGAIGSVAQGVQQPYEISVVTGIDKAIGINLLVSTYPNPTSDFVTLKVENYSTERLVYQLYDISGKVLLSQKVNGSETRIQMEILPIGSYFLNVFEGATELKSIKIIKNK